MSLEAPKDIPEIWRPHFDRHGIEFTFSALKRRVDGVSINTIIRALTGEGTPTRRVATKIGAVLGVSVDEFYRTRGELVDDEKPEPFHLPPRASNLAVSERRVVVSVVDAILGRGDNDTDRIVTGAIASAERRGQDSIERDYARLKSELLRIAVEYADTRNIDLRAARAELDAAARSADQ